MPPAFRHPHLRLLAALVAGPLTCGLPSPGAEVGPPPPSGEPSVPTPVQGRAWVILGSDTVRAEVAETPEARQRGLMHRTTLPEGEGMLFVFSSMEVRSFWMRDTLLPLDIAFLDDRLVILDVQEMAPGSDRLHVSSGPAMFALEVPGGWFQARGIGPGTQARIVFRHPGEGVR